MFNELGVIGDQSYEIDLDPVAKLHAIFTPRRVPYPIRGKVKEELTRMESLGVISKVEQATPWCAGVVAVPKETGSVRICVDLKPLNQNVRRQPYPLPTVDVLSQLSGAKVFRQPYPLPTVDVLSQLSGAKVFKVFYKLDANSGFWQIHLAPSLNTLLLFWHNLDVLGLSSAPELFQKRMQKLLTGLNSDVCLIDNVLVFATD